MNDSEIFHRHAMNTGWLASLAIAGGRWREAVDHFASMLMSIGLDDPERQLVFDGLPLAGLLASAK